MKNILDKIKTVFNDKVKPFFGKLKPVFEKIKPIWNKLVSLLVKYKRYIGVAGLFVCMVLILVFFTGEKFNAIRIAKLNSKTVSGEDYVPDAKFEVNAYEDVNTLISKYFTAYVDADFTTLEEIATPISDMEKSYITTMSQFYDAYQNINCYTKHGLSKDSYIVSVTFDIKFTGYDVTAPSMVLFYVQTAKDGSLYINNLYSDFNMKYFEEKVNSDVYTALRKYTTQDDYLELYTKIETSFNELIKSNTDIYTLTKRTIPGTRQLWEETVYYVEKDSESTEDTEDTEETTQVTENTQEETENSEEPTTQQVEPQPTVQKIKIVNTSRNVNIRQSASASSADIGDAYNGDIFVKLGEQTGSDGYKWIKIQFEGNKVGYVRSDFTQAVTE